MREMKRIALLAIPVFVFAMALAANGVAGESLVENFEQPRAACSPGVLAGVGSLSAVQGEAMVFAMTGPGWRPARKGMSLESGDNVKAAKGSSVSVQFDSGAVATLKNEGQVAVRSDSKLTLFSGYLTAQKGGLSVNDAQTGETVELRAGQSVRSTSPELIDDETLEIESVFYKADLAGPDCFPKRDGQTGLVCGKTAIITLGNGVARFNSRWIYKGEIDLNKAPWMDLWLRTESDAPVSILLQVGDDTRTWHQIPVLKKHNYPLLDGTLSTTKTLNDGQWHRLSWNLKQMVQKKFGPDASTVRDIIIGKWAEPEAACELEIREFQLGGVIQDQAEGRR